MPAIVTVSHLSKTYASGHRALDDINLEIQRGEIFALLGPNGAGKTTLISIICGIVRASSGTVVEWTASMPCATIALRARSSAWCRKS